MDANICRTAAVIHLDRLKRNIANMRSRLRPETQIMFVIKADAYGHGIAGIYPTLHQMGISCYAAAVWEEGKALRECGATEPILLLGDTRDYLLPELLRYRLTPAILQLDTARKLDALAKEAGIIQPIHIKLDTGMNRIGFPATDASVELIKEIAAMKNLRITGAFTHFPRAEELDRPETEQQLALFLSVVEKLREQGVEIPMLHASNSAAVLLRSDAYHLDAVRIGDSLYGLSSIDNDPVWQQTGLEEIMTWESYVAQVKTVPAGSQIGYGGTWVTPAQTRIATIPVGFVDGYNRSLSNRGCVMIHGQEAPIRGKVCMDQFMVDVTHIDNVQRGDRVELVGDGISMQRLADMAERTVDEIVCGISHRVPRVYVED